MTGT
jgi:hypothetical protein